MSKLRIAVCVKQVFDPTAPASAFEIDREAGQALPPRGSPPVLNPYDENALEAALRIKDAQEAEITVLSLGPKLAKMVLLKTVAAGADRLILLEDPAFDRLDAHATAHLLVRALRKIGAFDLVLCGRQADDTNAGQVGLGIAELLDVPCLTVARKIDVSGERVRVERETSEGYEVVEAPLPCVVTAGSEIGDLRFPPVKALMDAKKKPVPVWKAPDLEAAPGDLGRTRFLDILPAPPRESRCEWITASSPAKAGELLAIRLREAGVV